MPPQKLARRHEWLVDQVIVADDGTALLIDLDVPGRVVVERIDPTDGHAIEGWVGDAQSCRQPSDRLRGKVVQFVLLPHELVALQKPPFSPLALCRWRFAGGGKLASISLADEFLASSMGPLHLARDLIVHRGPDQSIFVSTMTADRLATIPPPATPWAVATDHEGAALLVWTRAQDANAFWLFKRVTSQLSELSLMSAATTGGSCASPKMALTADTRMAVLACPTHLQLWAIAEDGVAHELLDVLPMPPGIEPESVAFSADGQRLVVGSNGLAVWRTAEWTFEAVQQASGFVWVPEAVGLSLTADGSGLATNTGFWQLVPSAAPESLLPGFRRGCGARPGTLRRCHPLCRFPVVAGCARQGAQAGGARCAIRSSMS